MKRASLIILFICIAADCFGQSFMANRRKAFTASSLPNQWTNGLVCYWRLEESSGNRADALGNVALSANGSVLRNTGRVNYGMTNAGVGGVYLSALDSDFTSVGDINFTITFWVMLHAKSARQDFVYKYYNPGNSREYLVYYDNAVDRLKFLVSSDGSLANAHTATFNSAPSLATWYFVVCYHNASTDLIGISVTAAGDASIAAFQTTAHAGGIFDGSSAFALGYNPANSSYALDGAIDEVGLFKGIPTASSLLEMFNSGNGVTYP